jgi:beta-glucosidase
VYLFLAIFAVLDLKWWCDRHGLSYTTFEYSDLGLSDVAADGADIQFSASVTLKNIGARAGAEVIQLYVSWPATSELSHPPFTLKAFKKLTLEPGASERATLALDKYAFSSWSERLGRWVVEKGEYTVSVGPSSDVLPLNVKLGVNKVLEWNGL